MALDEQKRAEMQRIAGQARRSVPRTDLPPIGEAAKQLEVKKDARMTQEVKDDGVPDVATGFAKGLLSTVKGAGELGTKIGKATVGRLVEKITGEGFETADIFTEGTEANRRATEILEAQTPGEKIGKFIEQTAEFAIPGTKVVKAGKGLPLARQLTTRGLTSGGVATVQAGEVGPEAGIATFAELAIPVVGKPLGFITKKGGDVLRRFLKGLGAPVEEISQNPQAAAKAFKDLKKADKEKLTKVFETEVNTVLKGIDSLKKDASAGYRKGLEKLGETTADIGKIQQSVKNIFPEHGIDIVDGKPILENADFLNPTIRKRAGNLITTLNEFNDKSGTGIRKLIKTIESSKFKNTGGNDDKIAYNLFANDLENAFKKSIPELDAINKEFSGKKQIIDNIEGILGKRNFKNAEEFRKASEKLKTALKKVDIPERDLNNFLDSIGIEPTAFRAEEAVRQAVDVPLRAEQAGISLPEIVRQFTAGLIDEKAATKFAIKLQNLPTIESSRLLRILENIKPTAKGAFIESLTNVLE